MSAKPQHQSLILQIEDNDANATVVEQFISRRADLKVETVRDGVSGLNAACTAQPAVILTDIRMPGLDGVALTKLLRESLATAHIPVIAISSSAFAYQVQEGLSAGFFRYLTKPYRLVELEQAIDAALLYASDHRKSSDARLKYCASCVDCH